MNTDEWADFLNQPHNAAWTDIDSLTFREIKKAVEICKGCAVTVLEMRSIIRDISDTFSVSPESAFDFFQRYGKGLK